MQHPVTLPNDFGVDLCITGDLLAEDMHFNQQNGMLTVEKVYSTHDGKIAYGVISAMGDERERRAYLMERVADRLEVFNGAMTMHLDFEMMMQFLSMTLEQEAHNESSNCAHILQKLVVND